MGKQKIYETPQLTVCGSVEEVTRAVFWSGTGDVWSSSLQSLADDGGANIDVPDSGCNDLTQQYCSGS